MENNLYSHRGHVGLCRDHASFARRSVTDNDIRKYEMFAQSYCVHE